MKQLCKHYLVINIYIANRSHLSLMFRITSAPVSVVNALYLGALRGGDDQASVEGDVQGQDVSQVLLSLLGLLHPGGHSQAWSGAPTLAPRIGQLLRPVDGKRAGRVHGPSAETHFGRHSWRFPEYGLVTSFCKYLCVKLKCQKTTEESCFGLCAPHRVQSQTKGFCRKDDKNIYSSG